MKNTQTNGQAIPQAVKKLKAAAESSRGARPLTARGVADLCGVELKTVHNWASEGLIPHFRTPGRHLRFEAGAVIQFLENCGYQVPSSGVHSVLVVASGALRSRLRRALKGMNVEWSDRPLDALVVAGRFQPDAIVVEPASLDGVSTPGFFDALNRALPNAKLVCLGGTGRVPSNSTRVSPADTKELRAELGV